MADRLAHLLTLLGRQPDDPFLLYGVAMEHKKTGNLRESLDYLARCLASDPNYCYAYYQQGQVHEQAGRTEEAADAYRTGLLAADRAGDAHARSELAAALDLL